MFDSKVKTNVAPTCSELEQVKHAVRARHLCAIDQFGVQPFGLNDAGWPRSTPSMLDRCQTMEQYKLLLSRLVETKVVTDNAKGLTLKERFALIRPRSVQTPLENEALAKVLAEYDMNKINTLVAKKELEAYNKAEAMKQQAKAQGLSTPPPAPSE